MIAAFESLMDKVRREVRGISPEAARERMDSVLLLDVREREDYAEGYIDGAENLSRGFLELRIETTGE